MTASEGMDKGQLIHRILWFKKLSVNKLCSSRKYLYTPQGRSLEIPKGSEGGGGGGSFNSKF